MCMIVCIVLYQTFDRHFIVIICFQLESTKGIDRVPGLPSVFASEWSSSL